MAEDANVTDSQDQQDTDQVDETGSPDNQASDFELLPPWAQKEIRTLRIGEGNYRTKLRDTEKESGTLKATLESIMKALNPGKDEDPAELARALKEKDDQVRQASIELSVYKSASKVGADPEALLDSASFMRKAMSLDGSSDTFGADLEALLKESVQSNPRLVGKKPPAAKASGAEVSGGSGGGKVFTRASIKAMSPEEYRANAEEIRKAAAEGRIK